MIGHKTSLKKFKKTETISSMCVDQNGLKLETNLKKKTQKTSKHSNTRTLNNMVLNNEWVNNEIKKINQKYLKTNENEHTTTQNLWDTTKAVLRGKFITIQAYLKNILKISNKPNPTSKRTRGTTNNARSV